MAKASDMKNAISSSSTKAAAGYRLVYEVKDRELLVLVVAVGKRERSEVYKSAAKR